MIRKEIRTINNGEVHLFFDTEQKAYLVASDAMEVFLDSVQKLKDYKDAEEQGLLMRLPCAIGSTIYVIPSWVNYRLNKSLGHAELNRVLPQIVDHIEFNPYGYLISTNEGMTVHRQEVFGETWFLTKEEAEQALETMKGGK